MLSFYYIETGRYEEKEKKKYEHRKSFSHCQNTVKSF